MQKWGRTNGERDRHAGYYIPPAFGGSGHILPLLRKFPNPNDYNIDISSGCNGTIWISKDIYQRKLLRKRQVRKKKYLQKAHCN